MRPLYVLLGTMAVAATLLGTYFFPSTVVSSGPITPGEALVITPAEGSSNFLGTFPFTVSYSRLPNGNPLYLYVCSSGSSPLACRTQSLQSFEFSSSSQGTMTIDIATGMTLVLYTLASGVSYTASSPPWALYSMLFVGLAILGVALMILGLALRPAYSSPKPIPTATIPAPPPQPIAYPRPPKMPELSPVGASP